jgi:pteridine reductase
MRASERAGGSMDLRGRTALVTGAGHRVGRAIAVALGAQGMRVAVHYNATADGARETVAQIEAGGGEATTFAGDLTDASRAPELIESVVRHFGQLDVLVNSAAVMVRTPFGEVTPEAWDHVMALNTRAPFFLAQAAAPHLRRANGVIVNIADLAAFETWPAYLPHGLSKAGVVYLTRALARVLAPEVRVGGIAPGVVLLPDDWSESDAQHLRETTPLHHDGTPEDVTRTVLFILDSDYLTGETIIVDGGRHVRT